MKPLRRNRLGRIVFGFVIASLAGMWAAGTVMSNREQVHKDVESGARLTFRMKSVCVGRFLIDMPEDTRVELRGARIDGIDIAAFDETLDEFHRRLSDREVHISALPDRLGGNRNLESAKEVVTDSGLVGKIFLHSRTVEEGTQGNGLEVEHYRHEGLTVEGLVHAQGISVDLSAVGRRPEWIEDLQKLVNKLVVNPDNRLPAEPGFCLDRAYVRDPLAAEQHEKIMMFAQLPKHSDVNFSLILAAGLNPDKEGLIERSNAALRLRPYAERLRVTQLRASQRKVNGLTGDELVESISEENDSTAHSFWWEVNGTADDVFVPHVMFKMTTGNGPYKPVPSSISRTTATALWDKVLPTFRLLAKQAPTRAACEINSDPGAPQSAPIADKCF